MLTAIANGVVVAPGEEVLGALLSGVVATDNVANGIDKNLVKSSALHCVLKICATSQMSFCEVGHGQLTILFESRIAVLRQVFLPVPNLLALCGEDGRFVVQANFNDAVNVAQTFLQFKIGMAMQASLKSSDDLMLVESCTPWAAHRQNKGPAKFLLVGCIQGLNFFELVRRAFCQARFALFVGRFGGQFIAHHGFASQLGVSANQTNLGLSACILQHLGHAVFQVCPRCKGSMFESAFGNPGGMFVEAIQELNGLLRGRCIQLFKSQCHGV